MKTFFGRIADFFAINKSTGIVLLTILLFGFGEELWSKFIPAYLTAKGQPIMVIGIYALVLNFFEGLCYVGGGYVTHRLGDRGSLIMFSILTLIGYLLFVTLGSIPALVIISVLLIKGWESLSQPVTLTTVGSTTKTEKQGLAFALQSIQKRVPMIIGPVIGGIILSIFGIVSGTITLVWVSFGLGIIALIVQWKIMPKSKNTDNPVSYRQIWRIIPGTLKNLLLAEIFTRWGLWLVREFIVIFCLYTLKIEPWFFGVLVSIEITTSLITYIPIGKATEKGNLKPYIGLSFLFFAIFPLGFLLAGITKSTIVLVIAFILSGLREIGEPARKRMITNLMPEAVRAKAIGFYWGIRSFAFCSSSIAGAVIWMKWGPEVLLVVASIIGFIGAGIFYLVVGSGNKSSPQPDN
jgi:predicted MFS family arabinose efflux permease